MNKCVKNHNMIQYCGKRDRPLETVVYLESCTNVIKSCNY